MYFARFYLVSHPQPIKDDPRLVWGPQEELAVSAGDGIGLNSVTSEHTAHVTLVVADDETEVPDHLRDHRPRYAFTNSRPEIAVVDTEGRTALVTAAPATGPITCVVECTGRDETFNARHHEHRDPIVDIERWHITIWPTPTTEIA
ncbi:hypothetical protein [Actinosynnema sp. NPDC023587]|uniref:hypothetical protein n=1 Tax=Actinosynnema sp. NPDC023587 TaxID=3154695 RepID=UPI0034062245